MSIKSQEKNMRQIANLLDKNLTYYDGKEDKKTFLNKSCTFLRNLGRDLGLSEMEVNVNPAGIAVSGESSLIGVWEDAGIYVHISQLVLYDFALLYREARHMKDYAFGTNRYLTKRDLKEMSYQQILDILLRIT